MITCGIPPIASSAAPAFNEGMLGRLSAETRKKLPEKVKQALKNNKSNAAKLEGIMEWRTFLK